MPTKIEWTQETWNPITGCSPVSEGCRNCYARRMATRLAGRCGYPRDNPFAVNWRGGWQPPGRDWPVIEQPAHWKKPRMVFVGSMGDLFHEDVPEHWIDRVFCMMTSPHCGANHHTYLLLTKRPQRIYADGQVQRFRKWRNIWLGVTAENHVEACERIPWLLQIPAAVRFVSVEPMLGPVKMRRSVLTCGAGVGSVPSGPPYYRDENWLTGYVGNSDHKGKGAGFCDGGRLDWVIAGPETGPGARPCDPRWIEDLALQCDQAKVPFFDKRKSGWIKRQWPKAHEPNAGGEFRRGSDDIVDVLVGLAPCQNGKDSKMGMRELEGAIANELREIVGKRSIRVKDMMEWSTSEDVVRKNATDDETVIHCPRNGVWVAIASSKVPNDASAERR